MAGRNRISSPLVLFVMSMAFFLAAPLSHGEPLAAWRMIADGPAGDGIEVLDGADGCFAPARRAGLPCVTFREDAQPAAAYLYFSVDPARKAKIAGPAWLDDTEALVMLWGNVSEKETWAAVTDWVRRGGLVLYADGIGRLRTVEGDESPHDALFSPGADTGRGRAVRFAGENNGGAYRRFLCDTLAAAPELSRAIRRMVAEDGREDGVFVSLTGGRTLLWLNTSGKPAHKAGRAIPEGSVAVSGL